MSEWNPQVVIVEKIEKHPNADNLEIATVLGDYPVIIKTGEFKVNSVAAYFPTDTIVPDTQQFYFLCPKLTQKTESGEVKVIGTKYTLGSVPDKYRVIKAKKIRNIYSQGMLVPAPYNFSVGDSVVEFFNLKKMEEDEEEHTEQAKLNPGKTEKSPVGWSIPFYDVSGLRQYANCLLPDEEIVINEKIHGANSSYCFDGEKFWVKSRNLYKRRDGGDSWWDIAIRYNLEEKLTRYPNLVFFGELYGLVKGFKYDTTPVNGKYQSRIRFFDIWDRKTGRYLDYDKFVEIINDLQLDMVPELYRGKWLGKDQMYPYAEGLTTLGGKHIREGFVVKTTKERFEPKLNSRMQLKLVGEGYNLNK